MLSKRILKILNLSIAVLLVGLIVAAWWYAWRPVPKTSGRLRAPVGTRATVVRDAYGVPHIRAGSIEDALFLQGYVTAQERMWQMDALRRLAAGELSEVVGRTALEADRGARSLRMPRIAEAMAAQLTPPERSAIAAYTRGVNYYLETNRGRYGLEFALLRYEPRPWTLLDTMLAGLQMYRTLTTSWDDELQKSSLAFAKNADRAKVEVLFPTWTGREFQPGSNAWAISGAWTASGKPLLANDPHLEFSLPSTWFQVHLQAPGLNVAGVSLPGVPAVIAGHNERIAWGVTNLGFDVQDLYREQFNPANGQYLFRGTVEQARLEQGNIAVKGEKPVPFPLWVTRHGPLVVSEQGRFLALRWAAAEPGFAFPFLDLNRARNWQEFRAALSRYPGPGQNFVYADVDGNIGYQATGRLPIRKTYNGDLPADGASGNFEWEGFIPFDELPSSFNPPAGLIVTANQNPFPREYPYRVNGVFASQYRSKQIRDLLAARKGWRADGMIAVQKDVYSPFSHFLAREIVVAYDRSRNRNADLAEAVELLRGWNGQVDKESPAAMIAELAYPVLRQQLAARAAPGKGEEYAVEIAHAVVENLLRARPAGWFANWDEVLLKALNEAVEIGARSQGSNVKRWRWGQWNQARIESPVAGKLPWLGKYFNLGPVAMSGSSTTPKQTTRRVGPSMRFVGDTADWDRSLNNITIGQSAHRLSSHYQDQWDSYYNGRGIAMPFRNVEAKNTLNVEPGRE